MLTRRTFIKSGLAASVAVQLSACSTLSSSKSAHFEQQFDRSRKPNSQRPSITDKQLINVFDYGAKGDGKTLDTQAIQQAIDYASQLPNGGKVLLSKGLFLTGSISLKSKVQLHIDKDSALLGSTDITQYNMGSKVFSLISAEGCDDIAITGQGVINGQGRALSLAVDHLHHSGKFIDPDYNERRRRPRNRPPLLSILACKNIKVYDVTIENAALWVQHYASCEHIDIDNIKVLSDSYWNNDGIDIDNCQKVNITNCFVNAADDAICLKSITSQNEYNEDIYIANCTLRSSSNGIKFGTESKGGFKRVKIENIVVYDTYRSAIAIESVDGADIENISVDNVTATNVGCAIFIRLGQRNRDVPKDTLPGICKDITISNVKADIAFGRADSQYEVRGPALNKFFNPIPASITGLPGHNVKNVTLKNIEISYPGRGNKGLAYVPLDQLFLVPEEREGYPEYTMFGELPSWGLYVRHAEDITLDNMQLSTRAPDFRPALVFDDVTKLDLQKTTITAKGSAEKIVLNDVRTARISGGSGYLPKEILLSGNTKEVDVPPRT